jgi:hypothetical protein
MDLNLFYCQRGRGAYLKLQWVEASLTELDRDMKSADLKPLSVDELWNMHEQIVAELPQD